MTKYIKCKIKLQLHLQRLKLLVIHHTIYIHKLQIITIIIIILNLLNNNFILLKMTTIMMQTVYQIQKIKVIYFYLIYKQ